jgi:hypothetical protein
MTNGNVAGTKQPQPCLQPFMASTPNDWVSPSVSEGPPRKKLKTGTVWTEEIRLCAQTLFEYMEQIDEKARLTDVGFGMLLRAFVSDQTANPDLIQRILDSAVAELQSCVMAQPADILKLELTLDFTIREY